MVSTWQDVNRMTGISLKLGKRSWPKLGHKLRPMLSMKDLMSKLAYLVIFMGVVSFTVSTVSHLSTPVGFIASQSMTPLLQAGDIIFFQPAKVGDIRIGEIIAFQATPETEIVHRVVKKIVLPYTTYLVTQGDANDVTDQSVGYPPVNQERLLGRILCVDGLPLKIPFLGRIWTHVYNFSIWLTQNKPWSLWAPVLASLYLCWPTSGGGKRVFEKPFYRKRVEKKKILALAFVSFMAISLFTLWFRSEHYTLGMRIASLQDFPKKHNFNYGSMIYGQVEDNAITVTGAPMLPVKAVSVVKGNASVIATMLPKTQILEPNVIFDLNLHSEIPARGEIEPGLYEGSVHIFSSTLWLFLPDSMVSQIFDSLSNPWISALFLEFMSSLAIASSFTLFLFILEIVTSQVLYTLIWKQKRPEAGKPPQYLTTIKNFRSKIGRVLDVTRRVLGGVKGFFAVEGRVKDIQVFIAFSIASSVIYHFTHSFTINVLTLCLLSGTYAVLRSYRWERAVVGLLFSQILNNVFLFSYSAVTSTQGIWDFWSMVATGFAGSIYFVFSTPIVFAAFLLFLKGLFTFKVWILEQETLGWTLVKRAEFVLPSFGREIVEVVPRKIDVWKYRIPRLFKVLRRPGQLVAESCRVIEPLVPVIGESGKLDFERYVEISSKILVKKESLSRPFSAVKGGKI